MNNKGFIATSLIYIFFLVFISIMSALVGDYLANETIQKRLNDDIVDKLDNKDYSVDIYSFQNQINGAAHFFNIIQNSDFSNTDYWTKTNYFQDHILNGTIYPNPDTKTYQYIKDNYYDHSYYFQIEYSPYTSGMVYFDGSGGWQWPMTISNNNTYTPTGYPVIVKPSHVIKKYECGGGCRADNIINDVRAYAIAHLTNSQASTQFTIQGNYMTIKNVLLIDLDNTYAQMDKIPGSTKDVGMPSEAFFGEEGLPWFTRDAYLVRKKHIVDGRGIRFIFQSVIPSNDERQCYNKDTDELIPEENIISSNCDANPDKLCIVNNPNDDDGPSVTISNIHENLVCYYGDRTKEVGER